MRARCALLFAVLLVTRAAGADEARLSTAVVEPALAIQVALAHDTTDGVAALAAALAEAAASLGPSASQVRDAARQLAATLEIAEARHAFGEMNKALAVYMRAGKLSPPEGVRAAYCPMARGKWLQKDGALENPYYGRKMAACGGFTD